MSGTEDAGAAGSAAAVATIVIDRTGTVRGWSDGAAKLLGLSASDAVGRSLADLVVPEPLRAAHTAGVSAWAAGHPGTRLGATVTVPVRHREGRVFPAALTLEPIRWEGQDCCVGVLVDVDDPRHVRPAMPSDALQQIFERAPEAITVLDHDLRQRNVNSAGSRLFGYGSTGPNPGDGRTLVHPDDRGALAGLRELVLGGGTGPAIRYRVLAGDGTWRWIETLLADLRDVPEIDGLVAFSRDVTADEERRVELDAARNEAVAAAAAVRAAAAAQFEFAAAVSHELRTALAAISGAADLLADAASEDDRYLAVIRRNTARLAVFVDDLLTLTEMGHGTIRLECEEVDLLDIVRDAADDVSTAAAARGIHLVIEGAAGGVASVDPTRCRQLVENLLTNAVKYASEGSTIRVGVEHHGDRWTVTVDDTGLEIDPEDAERIFEPFVRTAAAARGFAGSGLGLALARAVAELHGGTLRCTARPGGARFVLDLPGGRHHS